MVLRQQLLGLKQRHPRPQVSTSDKLFWVTLNVAGASKEPLCTSTRSTFASLLFPTKNVEIGEKNSRAPVATPHGLLNSGSVTDVKSDPSGFNTWTLLPPLEFATRRWSRLKDRSAGP